MHHLTRNTLAALGAFAALPVPRHPRPSQRGVPPTRSLRGHARLPPFSGPGESQPSRRPPRVPFPRSTHSDGIMACGVFPVSLPTVSVTSSRSVPALLFVADSQSPEGVGHLSLVPLSVDGRWGCPCLPATEDAGRGSLPRGGAAGSGSHPTSDVFEDHAWFFIPASWVPGGFCLFSSHPAPGVF